LKKKFEISLTKQGFDGKNAPIIRGSGLKALEAKDINDEWAQKVLEFTKLSMNTFQFQFEKLTSHSSCQLKTSSQLKAEELLLPAVSNEVW
jgi:hypothetical protein